MKLYITTYRPTHLALTLTAKSVRLYRLHDSKVRRSRSDLLSEPKADANAVLRNVSPAQLDDLCV